MRNLSIPLVALVAATSLPGQDPALFEILDANRMSAWHVLGPFPSATRAGLATAFIDETITAIDPEKVHVTADGVELRWKDPGRKLPDGKANSLRFIGGDYDTVYVARTITAIADHRAVVAFGFDDSMAMWVNGEEVFRKESDQGVTIGQHEVSVRLRRGDNLVLLKVNNKRGGFGFAYELTDRSKPRARWGGGAEGDGLDHYKITTVPIPENISLEVGGLEFLDDGALLVCTRKGEIHRVANPAATDTKGLGLTTFARGLHEPLGMLLDKDGSLLVAQMPELTRLRDVDGDGVADTYETVVAEWGMSGNYHEYHFGPVRDGAGNLWGTLNIGFPSGNGAARLYRGSAYRLSPEGAFEIVCYGLRSPNGLTVNDEGDVFYTDNQGEWMDVCRIAHLQPKKYYGHHVPLQWADKMTDHGWEKERTLPAVWYPYHLMRSTSWPVFDRTDGAFGPYTGQVIVGDQNNSLLVRTTMEKVNGEYQGACYPFWHGFAGGINRLAFDDKGVLYVGLTNRGWGSVAPAGEGLQRFEFTGKTPFDLLEVKATAEGFELIFTKPLSAASLASPRHVRVREYGYRYWQTYGSPEVDSRFVDVTDLRVSDDRKRVALTVPDRKTGKAFHIELRGTVESAAGEASIAREAFYTLLSIPGR